ncbi:delta(12)-fatty-acid desaturase FAD2-like [Iris pallida]|uniref:Delta(12)-fatty-acid desaturase FAD2-like n=1 Tax=Iris pallida TaxID=29817 RepID=A0AAX6IHH1_IRIPA|nr:delta(12)-fatty-acid desaturase FAD2-like [Iris pallida]
MSLLGVGGESQPWVRAGGRMTEMEQAAQELRNKKDDAVRRVPTEKLPFTVGQLEKAIPHCFERSIIKTLSYVVHDQVISSILLYIAFYLIPTLPFSFLFSCLAFVLGLPGLCPHRRMGHRPRMWLPCLFRLQPPR